MPLAVRLSGPISTLERVRVVHRAVDRHARPISAVIAIEPISVELDGTVTGLADGRTAGGLRAGIGRRIGGVREGFLRRAEARRSSARRSAAGLAFASSGSTQRVPPPLLGGAAALTAAEVLAVAVFQAQADRQIGLAALAGEAVEASLRVLQQPWVCWRSLATCSRSCCRRLRSPSSAVWMRWSIAPSRARMRSFSAFWFCCR